MMSHPNLLNSYSTQIVIIDVQSRLLAVMPEDEVVGMIATLTNLLAAVKIFQVPVLVTEQYPQGLGSTEVEISRHLPDQVKIFSKTGFSACSAKGFSKALVGNNRQQLILCGQETHICVLQTAFELMMLGFQVYVLKDAVCSRHVENKDLALQRMLQQGITTVCLESVLFEWLKDAKHADFKAISSLIR